MFTGSPPPFPAIRRVITGHTAEGKSIVVEDAPVAAHPYGAKKETYFTDLFWTDEFPSENAVDFKDLAKEHEKDHFSANGSSFRLSEFPPGGAPSPFHRTVSLDYGIVLSGSITLFLDDNKRVVLNAGDVIVQRGTIHGWVNEGTEWARVFFVMLPSQKVRIEDKELGPEFRVTS